MKKILLLCIALLFSKMQYGQLVLPKDSEDLYTWQFKTQIYLDSLRTQMNNDAIFFDEGSKFAEFKRFNQTWEPLLFPTGKFNEYNQRVKTGYLNLNPSNFANNDPWHEIGPTSVPTPAIQTSGIGPTEFVSIAQSNSQKMLCGSNRGGLYVTSNGGNNWVNAGSDTKWMVSECNYAAFDPSSDIKWYALSEKEIWNTGGIYRTLDDGNTYEIIGDQFDFNGGSTNLNTFVIDPLNTDVMYLATTDGLYKSTNINFIPATAVTWSKLSITTPTIVSNYFTSVGYTVDPNYRFVWDIEFKPGQTNYNVIYVTVKFKANSGANSKFILCYMQSTDAGLTWSILLNHPALNEIYTELNIEVCNAYPNFLYCLSLYSNVLGNDNSVILRFNTNSNSWKTITTTAKPSYGNGEAFGANHFNGNIYVSYGINFNRYIYNSANDDYTLNSLTSTHDDVEDIVGSYTNSNEIWVCNHGGISKSIDGGVTNLDFSNGLGISQPLYSAIATSNADDILCGLYHDGEIRTTSAYSSVNWKPTWKYAGFFGDGNACIISNQNPNEMYASTQYTWHYTTNKFASSWQIFLGTATNWDHTGVLDKIDNNVVFLSLPQTNNNNKEEIVRSTNKGNGLFVPISNFSSYLLTIMPAMTKYHIWRVYTPYNHSNYLLAHILIEDNGLLGWDKNVLVRTKISLDANPTNIINSWHHLPLPVNSWLGQLNFDATNPNIVYLPFSSSNPNGQSNQGEKMLFRMDYTLPLNHALYSCNPNPLLCNDLTYNLPNVPCRGFALEAGSDGGMYIATRVGVFFTNNKFIANSNYWQLFGTNLPHLNSNELFINYPSNTLRVNFTGRGFWSHNLYCPDDFDLSLTTPTITDNFYEVENSIYSTSVVNASVNLTYRAGNAIELNPGFETNTNTVFNGYIHACNKAGNTLKINNSLSRDNFKQLENESALTDDVIIWPNPTDAFLNIKSKQELKEIKINDLKGFTILTKPISQNELSTIQIDLSPLSNGIYVLSTISKEKKINRFKLIITK
nr:T9SS type A sorting domain-containing protein [Bacteroidota bacterium]